MHAPPFSEGGIPGLVPDDGTTSAGVEGLLRSGKPALSVSESKRVADFLARQKDLLILCAGSEAFSSPSTSSQHGMH